MRIPLILPDHHVDRQPGSRPEFQAIACRRARGLNWTMLHERRPQGWRNPRSAERAALSRAAATEAVLCRRTPYRSGAEAAAKVTKRVTLAVVRPKS